jgi:hypothetical protein
MYHVECNLGTTGSQLGGHMHGTRANERGRIDEHH